MSASTRTIATGLAVLCAGTLALAACSSSGSPSGSGGTTPVTSPGAGSSSPGTMAPSGTSGNNSPASLVPAAVKSKGTFVIASDASYPPMEFFKPGTTSPIIGMDADLGAAIGKVLGLDVKLQNATFDGILIGIQSGKYDAGMSSFTVTKKREQTVDFVTYYSAGESFYIKSDNSKTYDGLDSLCGVTVAVENGTTEQSDAQSQSKKCTAAGKPAVTVLQFADQSGANLAVSSGRAEVGFADSPPVDYIVQTSNGQFKNTGQPFGLAPYGIALPKGNGMAAAVQAAMKQLIANGQYAAMLKKWNLSDGAITSPEVNPTDVPAS